MIKIQNIYYMLAYAFQVLNEDSYADIAFEEFEHVGDLLAAILSKGLANQLKRGLGREYLSVSESLSAPRGKINISSSIRTKSMLMRQLICEYDEFSINNNTNQIIKASAMLPIKADAVNRERKKSLKKLMLYFSAVDEINTRDIRWSNIRYHRNNATYKMLMNICYLIIEALLPTTQQGHRRLMQFKDDHMHRLYEKFILEYYKKHYPQYHPASKEIKWDVVGAVSYLPTMQSDIILIDNERKFIIDAKYYGKIMQSQYDVETVRSNNLYQIFSYVKNEDKGNTGLVDGMLLYAKTDEVSLPNITYEIGGNKISVKTLNLNMEFFALKEQLDSIIRGWTEHR